MAKNYAENYPKIIYKYRSWANEYHRNILLKNQVYLSSPIEFNDPFDCKIPKNFLLIDSPEKIEKYVNDVFERQNSYFVANGFDIENEKQINTSGKRVLVIGGGDTGADCVGTSVRQGAKNIIQIEILDKPSVERNEQNPWPQYPIVLKISTSHEESEKIYGKDPREWNILTKEFLGDENGNVSGIKVAKAESYLDENGRLGFRVIAGSDFIIEVDVVFLAIGFVHPVHDGLIKNLNLELDERGNVKANDLDYKASKEKYFVAGDVRRGQSLVVWAIREGRDAAKAVDDYLDSVK